MSKRTSYSPSFKAEVALEALRGEHTEPGAVHPPIQLPIVADLSKVGGLALTTTRGGRVLLDS